MRNNRSRRTSMILEISNNMTTAETSSNNRECRIMSISNEFATIKQCTCTTRGISSSVHQPEISINNSIPCQQEDLNERVNHLVVSHRISPEVWDAVLLAVCTCWRNRCNRESRSQKTSRLDMFPTWMRGEEIWSKRRWEIDLCRVNLNQSWMLEIGENREELQEKWKDFIIGFNNWIFKSTVNILTIIMM